MGMKVEDFDALRSRSALADGQKPWRACCPESVPGLLHWLSGKESSCQCRKTGVRSLLWEDPTSCGATKLGHRIYKASALEPGATTTDARAP